MLTDEMARPPNIMPRMPARALLLTLAHDTSIERTQSTLGRRLHELRRELQVAYAAWWIALNEARPTSLATWMAMALGEETFLVDAPSAYRADPGFRLRFDDAHLPPLHPDGVARWLLDRIVISRLNAARIDEEVQQVSSSRRTRARARLQVEHALAAEPERAGVIRALSARCGDEPAFHDLPDEARALGWRCETLSREVWATLCAHHEVHYGEPGGDPLPLHMRFVPLEYITVDPRTERPRPAGREVDSPFDAQWLAVDADAVHALHERLVRLLEREPDAERWRSINTALVEGWSLDAGAVLEQWLPQVFERLGQWPVRLRTPIGVTADWMERVMTPREDPSRAQQKFTAWAAERHILAPHPFERLVRSVRVQDVAVWSRLSGMRPDLVMGLKPPSPGREDEEAWITLITEDEAMEQTASLDLSGLTLTDVTLRALAHTSRLGRLRALDLSHNAFTTDGLEVLLESKHLSELEEFRLARNALDTYAPELVAEAPTLKNLRVLDLSHNPLDQGAHDLARAAMLKELRVLLLRSVGLDDEGARWIARAPHLKQLRVVDLTGNRIAEEGARWLARSKAFITVQELRLAHNDLGDGGAAEMAEASHLFGIRTLDLSFNGIGDDGAAALATAIELEHLEVLELAGNPITQRGVESILSAKYLSDSVKAHVRRTFHPRGE